MYTYETLLDHYYDEWERIDRCRSNEERRIATLTYADMIDFAHDKNPLHALIILVVNYNGQVCNGGHSQYVFNGYAHGVGGCFDDHPTTEMHDLMLSLFVQLGLTSDGRFIPVLSIMRMLKVDNETYCDYCDGDGYLDDDIDSERYGCCMCDSTGASDTPGIDEVLADKLDDVYYAINDQFMTDFKETINARLQQETS